MKQFPDVINTIVNEIEFRKSFFPDSTQIQSVYFGGGTPSLLNGDDLYKLMNAINNHFNLVDNPEVTLEANPDDISIEKNLIWKAAGVNRLSLGIQSFFDRDLKLMNRAHDSRTAHKALDCIQNSGLFALSADLIYGIPGCSLNAFEENLEHLFSYNLPHFSAYALTVEPKTLLDHQIKKGEVKIPDDEDVADQFQCLQEKSAGEGYEHYELSGFARNGNYAIHNSAYWAGFPYLGLGPGAHSYTGTTRSWNIANNAQYVKKIRNNETFFEEEVLTQTDQYNEFLLTRLRTQKGFDVSELRHRFGDQFYAFFLKASQIPARKNLLIIEDNTCYIPEKFRFISDSIISDLLST